MATKRNLLKTQPLMIVAASAVLLVVVWLAYRIVIHSIVGTGAIMAQNGRFVERSRSSIKDHAARWHSGRGHAFAQRVLRKSSRST
jgi:uncharacterized protein HemY